MYEWEYILTRKEAFALHRFLAAPLMLGLALGLLYSRLPGPGNALGAQERLGLFVTLLLIFAFDGVRRRGAIEDRVTWEDVLAGRLTLATHVGVVCRGGVVVVVGVLCGGYHDRCGRCGVWCVCVCRRGLASIPDQRTTTGTAGRAGAGDLRRGAVQGDIASCVAWIERISHRGAGA